MFLPRLVAGNVVFSSTRRRGIFAFSKKVDLFESLEPCDFQTGRTYIRQSTITHKYKVLLTHSGKLAILLYMDRESEFCTING